MEQLSGLDAAFLYLETSEAPMHIGGLSILSGSTPDGPLDLPTFRDFLAGRLATVPAFQRRLAHVPLNLGRPYWVEDESFDLDRHLETTRLPEPGGFQQLSALMAYEMSRPLPRDRPLWQVLFVEGVDGVEGVPPGSVALISRVHHAAIDGVSGVELLGALYDPDPDARPAAPAPAARAAEEPHGNLDLLLRAGGNLLRTPMELPRVVGRSLASLARTALRRGLAEAQAPPSLFSAPRTLLNLPVTRQRTWAGALLPLERVRKVRASTGVTLNDVVLAVAGGALRRYLLERGGLPDRPLVAMVPISVRRQEERGALGNQVSAMLVSLETDEADPGERLRKIRRGTEGSKAYHRAIGARTLTDSASFIPFSLAGLSARLYTRWHLAQRHNPMFNLVITNVPGPQLPLYVAGARVLAHFGSAPVFDGMGLLMAIFSYAGSLSIGLTAARNLLPDPESLAGNLEQALEELESALG